MDICLNCGRYFHKAKEPDVFCFSCNKKLEEEHGPDCNEDLGKIYKLETEGHTYHCACRQVWGDGECECIAGC